MGFTIKDDGSKAVCTRCGKTIPNRAATCPHCGACQGCD